MLSRFPLAQSNLILTHSAPYTPTLLALHARHTCIYPYTCRSSSN